MGTRTDFMRVVYVFTDSYAGLWLLAISLVLPIVEMIGVRDLCKKTFRNFRHRQSG